MDLLTIAVVDITTLVATCRALKCAAAEDGTPLQRQLRHPLRRDLKRGTVAYIDALARDRRGVVDEALLATCRLAAEAQMAQALAHQDLLCRVMGSQTGALDGLAAARQDLWRLAHLAMHLNTGLSTWRASSAWINDGAAEALTSRLRRRFRKALIAYARQALRTKVPQDRSIRAARQAALAVIGRRGAAEAERLADLEGDADPAFHRVRQGVTKPLLDLALDWQRSPAGVN